MKNTHCYICNAVVPDIVGPVADRAYIPQSPGCWKLYTEVLAREYGEWNYPSIHRLTVDCYCAQHPTKTSNTKAAQSIQIHLLGIYLSLEDKLNYDEITTIMGSVVNSNKNKFAWLQPPKNLGKVTISEVWKAKTLQQHEEIVHTWAESIWNAWESHHDSIKELLKTTHI